MKAQMDVMMLAAGLGTRLRPHTEHLPKPAIPFLNIPLVYFPLHLIHKNFDIQKLVTNLHHLPEIVQTTIEQCPIPVNKKCFSHEEKTILGSGGGLGFAKKYFQNSEDLLLTNSDELILPEDAHFLRKALIEHKKTNALATLIVMDHHLVGSQFGGVWINNSNKVLGFGKSAPNTNKDAIGMHFLGMQFLSKRVFDYIPENKESNILYDVLSAAIQSNELVQIYKINALWFETGNEKDYLNATRECLNVLSNPTHQQHLLLKEYINCYANSNFSKTDNCISLISKSTKLENINMTGNVVVGQNLKSDQRLEIKNSVIGNDIKISSMIEIENSLITF